MIHHLSTHGNLCRQLQAGVAAAFETVHDAAKLKAAVVALHRSAAAKEAARQPVPDAGGGSAIGDAAIAAAVMAEAGRSAFQHTNRRLPRALCNRGMLQRWRIACASFQ